MSKTCIIFSFSTITSFTNTVHAILMINFNIRFPFFARMVTIGPTYLKLCRVVAHEKYTIPIDIEVIRTKSKVTMTLNYNDFQIDN